MKTNFSFEKFNKTFIVAELSANHNGSLDIAINTIKAAKRAGADAIKFQTYTPDTITIDSKNEDFIIKSNSIWDGKTFHNLYKSAYTPWEWHNKLFEIARKEGLICFSSPFDFSAVDFLEELGNPIYKIASFEITDIPLIEYVAKKNKPIILSSGISEKNDIKLALETIRKYSKNEIVVLKCTSSYPAQLDDANLCMIKHLTEEFNVMSGLSDHTLGITSPILAVSFGAKVIEKHFILDKSLGGPDSTFSLDEIEFTQMVNAVREAEKAIGIVDYQLTDIQKKARNFSRSIYVVKDINKGDFITNKNVKSIRPGFSLHPKYLNDIIGKKAIKDLKFGDRISFNDIEGNDR